MFEVNYESVIWPYIKHQIRNVQYNELSIMLTREILCIFCKLNTLVAY